MTDLWTETFSAAIQVLTFTLGLLGAIAFYWQFQQRRARRVRFLNLSVFRPWSKVELKQWYQSTEGRPLAKVRLLIPKDAVSDDVDPTVTSEGLDIGELAGLENGARFLRSPPFPRWSQSGRALRDTCRRASRDWDVVTDLVEGYETVRARGR